MTPRQREVFNFIRGFIAQKGYSPTYQEIADCNHIKTRSRVYIIIRSLIDQNYLSTKPKSKRQLQIVQHYCPHCQRSLCV